VITPNGKPPTRLEELQIDTWVNELMVGNSGYPHHLTDLLRALFEKFDGWLLNAVGFTVGDIIAIDAALPLFLGKKVSSHAATVGALGREMFNEFREFRRTQRAHSENHAAFFEKLRTGSNRQARPAISRLHTDFLLGNLGTVFCFTPEQLSAECGVAVERVSGVGRRRKLPHGTLT